MRPDPRSYDLKMFRHVLLGVLALLLWACPQAVNPLEGNKDAGPLPEVGVIEDGGGPEDSGGLDSGELDSGDAGEVGDSGACVPACGARVCGMDPVCNTSCGSCAPDKDCTPQGQCLDSCVAGSYLCTADATGFTACGPNPALGINDYGARIACAGGGTCRAGQAQPCSRAACAPVDMMLVVDRSSRIAYNATWSWMRETLSQRMAQHDHVGRFGLRQFPDAACGPGPIVPLAEDAAQTLDQTFQAPGSDPSTPLAASLTGLSGRFVPGVDAQAVLLLTAGDESCGDPEEAVAQAGLLYRIGVRVYVVGMTTQANMTLLHRIAVAGGTQQAYAANTRPELEGHLTTIFGELGACENPHATVASGWYHTCRLKADGRLDCWGRDYDGRLSPPPGRHIHLAAGTDNACAVGEDHQVRCWGRDQRGQSQAPSGSFVQVAGGDSHFCGLKLDGSAHCWGYDDAGQASPPVGTFKQVATGGFHGCAIQTDDTVVCWGGRVAPAGTYRQIDAGGNVTCGVHLDGTLGCSGGEAPPTGTFVQVDQGYEHACAVRTDGTVACWGLNHWQQSEPPAGAFVSVSVNNTHSCGVRPDDTVECWGYGGDGQAAPPN